MDIETHEALMALADRLWSHLVGAHADPLEFNLMAKLALEQRLLGRETLSFGLDKLASDETAAYLGLQTPTLHDKQKRRALGIPEPYNIGRKLFWRRSELDAWIERQAGARRPPKRQGRPLRATAIQASAAVTMTRPILHLKDSAAPIPPDVLPQSGAKSAPKRGTPPIPKPRHNIIALETGKDVSADLAPEYRNGVPRKGHIPIAAALVECVRDVPLEPKATRALRLALAVIDLAPELPPGFVTLALAKYGAIAEDSERRAAEELRRALMNTVMSARLARFRRMVESALAIAEAQRAKD